MERNRKNPREREVKLRFNDEELQIIDRMAAQLCVPRAALLRDLAIQQAFLLAIKKDSKVCAA